jgi:hypothetical protein
LTKFSAFFIKEPDLVFGHQKEEKDPKIGLKHFGPYYAKDEKTPSPMEIRIGIVGTGVTITLTKQILRLLGKEIKSNEDNLWLYPDYPGFKKDNEVKCEFVNSDRWNEIIKTSKIEETIAIQDVNERITLASDLFVDKIEKIMTEDSLPHVVICTLPLDIEKYCGISRETRGAKHRKIENTATREENKSQKCLEEWIIETNLLENTEEDELSFDLRNAIKGKAMKFDVPTQVMRESVARSIIEYPNSKPNQDPAAFCWNISTGLYYKANGRPWRLAKLTTGTCYVGISFYHNKRNPNLTVEISMAQVFTHSGEGFVLRGSDVTIDKDSREVHLTKNQAYDLLKDSVKKYSDKVESPPERVVVYKTSFFSDDEKAGFNEALGNLKRDYVGISRNTDLRILRTGKYAVLRGTLVLLSPNECLLYTSGYIPRIRTYPGHRVPRPLLITHFGDSEITFVCSEILGLTKLNWNTTAFSKQLPITIEFAQSVGKVLSEIPSSIKELKDHYRFYM